MSTDLTPLRLAVVGHTNTGKTSLLRTLTRDKYFGEVRDSPGTTRHVEGVRLQWAKQPIELFDTPGMEDSMALWDYLQRLSREHPEQNAPQIVALFLTMPEAQARFEQEARVLSQLLQCDAALYVIDVRDPVLAKHNDELKILINAAKPILPVLNFVQSSPQRIEEWRTALAAVGLHALAEFDTVAPALNGEAQLYEKLALLVSAQHAEQLRRLSADVAVQRQQRLNDAWRILAELLIDVVAVRLSSAPDESAMTQAAQQLHQYIRQREESCVKSLLACFNFSSRDYLPQDIALDGYRWETDLFHPDTLKEMGIQVGKGVAAGALAGATFDLLTAGLSLGTGTLIGAAAGGLWQGVDKWGQRIMNKWRGQAELTVDESVIRGLAIREMALIQALAARGHAAQQPIALAGPQATQAMDTAAATASTLNWRSDPLPQVLLQARSFPDWSTRQQATAANPSRREQAVNDLAVLLGATDGASTSTEPAASSITS